MANHFRDSDRQGIDAQDLPQVPGQAPELEADQPAAPEAVPDPETDALVDQLMSELGTGTMEPVEAVAEPAAEVEPASEPASAPSPISVPDPLAEPASLDSTSTPAPVSVPDPLAEPAESAESQDEPAAQPVPMGTYAVMQAEPAPEIDRTGTPAISLRNVTLVYPAQPNKPALDDISLDIYPGEFVFLVGHSGSGKSTFIRLLNRELRATKGKVIVGGMDLTKMRARKVPFLRRQIGCVFQDFKLLPDKTTYENVAFALECIGKPKSVIDVQVPEVLRLVGLSDRMDSYPDQLSGGEQQRVSVARAMVNRPPLLICDEPTGNLDPAISLGIMKLLDRINRTGTTVVMATHDREMVDSMRRRVIALEAGHLVRDQERGGYGNYGIL